MRTQQKQRVETFRDPWLTNNTNGAKYWNTGANENH